jgi:hypothetical protein
MGETRIEDDRKRCSGGVFEFTGGYNLVLRLYRIPYSEESDAMSRALELKDCGDAGDEDDAELEFGEYLVEDFSEDYSQDYGE